MYYAPLSYREILQQERERVREAWTEVARLASAAARAARARTAYDKGLSDITKKKKDDEVGRDARNAAREKAGAAAGKAGEAAAKKAKAAEFDGKIKSSAENLYQMAQRGERNTDAYRQAYKAHQAVLEQKKLALGGSRRVEAPDKGKKPKAASRRNAAGAAPRYRKNPRFTGKTQYRTSPSAGNL